MPGRKDVFDQAMQAGDTAAWDQEWTRATQAYMQAVREFPTSTIACNSLGLALYHSGRLEDAFKVYGQAQRLDPNDPLPVEKSADVLERMGRVQEAAKQYLNVAEIYLGQHDLEKAIANWERATEITPGMVAIHKKLAMAYERIGQKAEAINEYLKLAFNFQRAGKPEVAMQALQRGLRLDSKEPRLLNAVTAVRANREIAPELLEAPESKPTSDEEEFVDWGDAADSDERGPLGEAVEMAMERLASAVFESGQMGVAEANAMQGVEMQRAGITDEAIGAYERAQADGLASPSLYLNLGVLMVENARWNEALSYLERVGVDKTLAPGVQHALSLAYIGQENWEAAATALIATLRAADLSLVLDETEAAELESLYTRLANMVAQTDDQTLENLSKRLADMLTGADWKRRVAQTRNRLEDIISKGSAHVLEDIAQGEGVMNAMGLIDQYIEAKRYNIAMDEAHEVIRREPDYLAAHLRIGQIMMELSRVEQAMQKFNLIARTYTLRGDDTKAADILKQAIRIAPADINLRLSLIEMLESQARWPEVLTQYINLGEAYRAQADTSNARMTFDQAMKLAQRIETPQEQVIDIMLKIAEIDMDRLDYAVALRTYQKVVEMAPQHVGARRQMIELYYRQNDYVRGVQEVDKLLQLYARQKRPDLIIEMLERFQRNYPDDMGLRLRLGTVYEQMNRAADAATQYEELRQLQTSAGLHDEARKTIKRIIKLQPEQAGHYQQLLQQLGG
ncbi:MAG: tetratricopeptide repeat protein [Anaerolineales bacterium]